MNSNLIKKELILGPKREDAKEVKGKPKWRLVNLKDLEGIVKVREYGTIYYKDPENWKIVPVEDYWDALQRHITEMSDKGIFSCDEKSKLPHIWHCLCNLMFMSYFMRKRGK